MGKFNLYVILMILIVSSNSYGQLISKGIKGGVNFANVGGEDAKNPDPQSITAFNAGVFATFNVNGTVVLQPEIIYSVKGFKVSDVLNFFGQNYSIIMTGKIAYLEIPILVKLTMPSSTDDIFKPNIFIGPELAIKLSAKVRSEVTGQPSQEQDLQNISSSDYGAIIGVGTDINLSTIGLTIDARYDYGLNNVTSTQNPVDVKHRVFSVNCGIKF